MVERGFFVKELNVGWKEWTANGHPAHYDKAGGEGGGTAASECRVITPSGLGGSPGVLSTRA